MIVIGANDTRITMLLQNESAINFSVIVATLKQYRCKYSAKERVWTASLSNYEEILKDRLEDLTFLEEDKKAIERLRVGKKEQVISSTRVYTDYSLLKYPPLKGKAPFEDFQKIDIALAMSRNRFAFFWEMGTGKTYAASALIAQKYLSEKEVTKIVYISSSIGARNVEQEINEFILNFPQEKVYFADKNNREPFTSDVDIVITSYNSFRLVCEHYKKKKKIKSKKPKKSFLPIEEWIGDGVGMLLLDESHEIANPTSLKGYFVNLHSDYFYYRYLFTGTFADKPEKQYNQLKTLDPYLVKRLNFSEWKAEYAELGTRYSATEVREWKQDKLKQLHDTLMSSYAVFRETDKVLDLPTHYIKRINIDMSAKHRELYERVVSEDLAHINTGSLRTAVNRFPFLLLSVDNPLLLMKHLERFSPKTQTLIKNFKSKNLNKFILIEEILDTHKGEKGIIWIDHPITAAEIANRFANLNPICITGNTPMAERNALVEQFKKNDKHKILIANIQVLNSSVTITEATFQVYTELIFSYVPFEQSSKRIYRNGQNKTVITYILLYNKSLDYLRIRNLDTKGTLIKGLLAREFLSQEEWVKIFNGNWSEAEEASWAVS